MEEQQRELNKMLENLQSKMFMRLFDSWDTPINVKGFAAFSNVILNGVEIVEYAQKEKVVLDKSIVFGFYTKLVETITLSAKHLITPIDQFNEDKFVDSPLLNLYICVASVLQYMKDTWPLAKDDMYYRKQSEIAVCKTYALDVAVSEPICNLNVAELVSSLAVIELRYDHPIIFDEDISNYIDALELRLSDILVHTYDEEVQNVVPFRVQREGKQYHCNTASEFQLIALMVGIHINKLGTLPHVTSITLEVIEDDLVNQICAHMHKVLISECTDVYGDALSNRFRETYVSGNIRVSEALMYMVQYGVNTTMNPGDAIEQFRGMAQWTAICEKAAVEPGVAIAHPENDFLAWKLLFHIAVDMVMLRTLNISWMPFTRCGVLIAKMSDAEYRNLMHESKSYPIFVDSYNCACIIYDGQFQKFGPTPLDYFKSLLAWVEIIFIFNKNKIIIDSQTIDIQPFVLVLTSNIHHKMMDENEASSSSSSDEYILPKIVEDDSKIIEHHPIRDLHQKYREKSMLLKELEKLFISKEMSTEGILSLGDHDDNHFVKDSFSGW